jgi:hypothetical protein
VVRSTKANVELDNESRATARSARNALVGAGCLTIRVASALVVSALYLSAQQDAAPRTSVPAVVQSGFIGVVVDSIHGGPLVGVEIGVLGTERSSTSDKMGRFRIDGIPPGEYRLTLSHPLFDTLGLSPTTQQITVTPHHYVVVALGTPSARTLRRQLCPKTDTTATPSFIMGRIRDADTGAPAAGAQVSMVYSTTAVALSSGVRSELRVRRTTAEPDGTYVICGLESDLRGTLFAERAGVPTAEIGTALDGKVIALRSLSTGSGDIVVVPSGSSGSPDSSQSSRGPDHVAPSSGGLMRGPASVTGFVLDSSGVPLAGAIVAVTSTAAATRTGTHGEFTLTDLPSGTQELAVRDVGFDPASLAVELRARYPRSVTVRLHRAIPSLAPVVVTNKVNVDLSRLGFFDRRQSGPGHFITPEQVAQAQPRVVSDLMYLVPGWQVQTSSSGLTVLLPPRSAYAEGASACVNVFIDGALMTNLAPGEFDSVVGARDVVAMEVYSGASVPAEFARNGGCVTIVVWTRARVGK